MRVSPTPGVWVKYPCAVEKTGISAGGVEEQKERQYSSMDMASENKSIRQDNGGALRWRGLYSSVA